jgi:hypothetical protein
LKFARWFAAYSAESFQCRATSGTAYNAEAADQVRLLFDIPATTDHTYAYQGEKNVAQAAPTGQAGLFGLPMLKSPEEFVNAAHAAVMQCQQLIEAICSAEEGLSQRRIIKCMDLLSDIICAVVDTAELLRNVHPEPRWVDASNEVYMVLGSFINTLNTHTGLYEVGDGALVCQLV